MFSSSQGPQRFASHHDGRRVRKVTRACDLCRSKKARCSGTKPCDICSRRGWRCSYDSQYLRGKLPTPTSSSSVVDANTNAEPNSEENDTADPLTSRGSPEASTADVHGQYVDPASGLSFLHRARRRFSDSRSFSAAPHTGTQSQQYMQQPLVASGDRPLITVQHALPGPTYTDAVELLDLYFDVCVATYRVVHQPSVQSWLDAARSDHGIIDVTPDRLGHARAAILLSILSIAKFNLQKSKGLHGDESMTESDCLIQKAIEFTHEETGLPTPESIQSRLLQVFYLLMTCRFNRAWYTFGMCLQMVSAMGLHRRKSRQRGMASTDYVQDQIHRRIFWSAYILDRYLGVVLGRPTHFHDAEIDQDFPDRVNDEDMTSSGPRENPYDDCKVDAFVFNAELAQIVGSTSRVLYGIRPASETERLASLENICEKLDEWHSAVPAFLSTVRPSTLVRGFRRQAIALQLAHLHAVMHLFRPFLLGHVYNSPDRSHQSLINDSLRRCMLAARQALELVDGLAREGPTFHAFWWTHYVTFCALAIVYVWKLQSRRARRYEWTFQVDETGLFELADRCQQHLASATISNSPSRRYSIILEELRSEAQRCRFAMSHQTDHCRPGQRLQTGSRDPATAGLLNSGADMPGPDQEETSTSSVLETDTPQWLAAWQSSDWLDLDASAFDTFLEACPELDDWAMSAG